MLKFESLANVGDIIKAYDFEPIPGSTTCFLSGLVTAKGMVSMPLPSGRMVEVFEGYTVQIVGGDEYHTKQIGEVRFVPFEVDMQDFDERISLIATADQVKMLVESL